MHTHTHTNGTQVCVVVKSEWSPSPGYLSLACCFCCYVINRRCCIRSASHPDKARERDMFVERFPRQVLGQHVCGVVRSGHLEELEILGPDTVLDPKLPGCKVTDLADARSFAYTDCCRTVGETFSSVVHPKSVARLRSPRPSAEPFTMPASSASAELNVKTRCVDDQCLTRWQPLKAQPPEVLLRVLAQPAKSVST